MSHFHADRIAHPQRTARHWLLRTSFLPATLLLLMLATTGVPAASPPVHTPTQAELFQLAWAGARSGDRKRFEKLGPQLTDYVLYPYWQYEDYRHRRAQVPVEEMAAFLKQHEEWAFTPGLKDAWLKTLGKNRRWDAVLRHGANSRNTEIRCYHARARLALKDTDGLLPEAQALWTVGKSQPDACDPLFSWLRKQGGITEALAWERIRLAMDGGNPRLTLYLARFLSVPDRVWLERWQRLDRERYRRLSRAAAWSDNPLSAMIAASSLKTLANRDAAAAMEAFAALDGNFTWTPDVRGEVMRQIGLMAAVALDEDADNFIAQIPPAYRDDQLQQWWARFHLAGGDWAGALKAIDGQTPSALDDDRWRYWRARAQLALGETAAGTAALSTLSERTNYYGFLAADHLQGPYTICPKDPPVSQEQIASLAQQAGFARALELHYIGLNNWALAEWSRATARLPTAELKIAAGLARREGWYDRAIFALGNSGELSFYEWRFPVLYEEPVMAAASQHDLDPAWVFGIMRSESAMTATARSPAGALGLMQVMPATAKTLSRQHGLPYRNSAQLLEGDFNIRFGTAYLRQLMDELRQNPVLVAGAYNAGPNAVARWLDSRPGNDPAIWIETLPYFETRDYIPRVLTFSILYDWRLDNPVPRITSRMPGIESGTMSASETALVVCRPDFEEATVAGP
jgi:soluble lytic murein transglycosylase